MTIEICLCAHKKKNAQWFSRVMGMRLERRVEGSRGCHFLLYTSLYHLIFFQLSMYYFYNKIKHRKNDILNLSGTMKARQK